MTIFVTNEGSFNLERMSMKSKQLLIKRYIQSWFGSNHFGRDQKDRFCEADLRLEKILKYNQQKKMNRSETFELDSFENILINFETQKCGLSLTHI